MGTVSRVELSHRNQWLCGGRPRAGGGDVVDGGGCDMLS